MCIVVYNELLRRINISKSSSKSYEERYGIKKAKELKKLRSINMKKMSKNHKGKNHPMYGKKHSEETKQKMSKNHKGKKLTDEHKRKIGEVMIGRKHSEEAKQKMSKNHVGMYGKKHSEETKQKMSEATIGKNNPSWQGGISFEPYSSEFNTQLKEQIRERDERLCQFCGNEENGKNHDVHHINYNKKDCSPKNLITLCQNCNKRANKERNKWELMFTILQEIGR